MHPKNKKLFIFGQTGHIPAFQIKQKLDARAATEKYVQIVWERHIMIQLQDFSLQKVEQATLML